MKNSLLELSSTRSLKNLKPRSFNSCAHRNNVANKVKILNENGDKQSQNTHVEVNIFARQKSKAQSRVWFAQNNLHIAET